MLHWLVLSIELGTVQTETGKVDPARNPCGETHGNNQFLTQKNDGIFHIFNHLNFRARSTFPVPDCTVPNSMDRTIRCDKVDSVRLYASYRLNLVLLKGQRCVNLRFLMVPFGIGQCHLDINDYLKLRLYCLYNIKLKF